ncbi:MAG: APC family permease [Geothrix sp.]|uniref:APC family permease n=1 Tax=Geothrix sp. TaxID=1962974 RepID=UPI00184F8827|nr:APC family permease [Geothrix sp.]NWJ41227.1 APC family permease [Geothrix sp.]WIL20782.1 MAG: APC family permease [Geothrix sp.]
MATFRRFLLGQRLASGDSSHTKVSNVIGLSVFSSDALSSVAYATQEIMASLSSNLHTAAAAVTVAAVHPLFGLSVPVALGIVGLLAILGVSYRQTILAYPTGGGAYIVAKSNLGELAALVAGSSLLLDYILTVSVSVSSGVAAITAAFPLLDGHNVSLTLFAIVFIALANLRGVKESGALFAIPTYGFVALMLILLGVGTVRTMVGGGPTPVQAQQALEHTQHFGGLALVWIFMRAYSAGCTALTGVEAVSNGVQAFKDPAEHNASKTLVYMVLLLGVMFLGITLLSQRFGIAYQHSTDPSVVAETLLSKLAKAIYGDVSHGLPKLMYYLTQTFTFAILVVAANTAYADFPRLAALMGRDNYLPRQFASQGDRLVFSNGILILTAVSCFLVWILHANTDLLLPLYALGVFTGFTISQAGMVVHWLRLKTSEPRWLSKALINGVGMAASGIVMVDIAITKFAHGAWLVVVLIPMMVWLFLQIHRHYIRVKSILAASRAEFLPHRRNRVVVLVSGIHSGVVQALNYAKVIADHGEVEAITVDFPDEHGRESAALERLRSDWPRYCEGIPLRAIRSPYRKIVEPIVDELDRMRRVEPEYTITVILPEFVTGHWWANLLHNQTAWRIKGTLLMKPKTVVISIPYHLEPIIE